MCDCYVMDHKLHSDKCIYGEHYMPLYNYDVAVQSSIFLSVLVERGEGEGGSVKSSVVTVTAYYICC